MKFFGIVFRELWKQPRDTQDITSLNLSSTCFEFKKLSSYFSDSLNNIKNDQLDDLPIVAYWERWIGIMTWNKAENQNFELDLSI